MFASNTSHSAEQPDAQFNYVTMLLPGNGTNGAQNNTFLDASTNNFTITRNGNTTQGTFSPYGSLWSNYFDGSGDYLSIPSSAGLRFDGQFCVEGWVNFNAFNTQNFLISQFTNAGEAGWLIRYTGTALRLYAQNGAVTIDRTWAPSRGVWYHFAVTRDSSNDIRFFIDGTQLGATATGISTTMSSTNTAYIGGHPDIANDTNAYLSNMRVVKGSAVYTANFTPSTTPLTAITNTSLLTCQSNRFIDNSSNAFTITRNGDVSVQRFSPFAPTAAYSAATIGGSGYFDGSGDYLSVADNAALDLGSSDFTLEAWVYAPVAPSSDERIFKKFSSNTGYGLFFNTSETVRFIVRNSGGTNAVDLTTGSVIVVGVWQHIAVTRSGNSWNLWVNGVSQASTTNSASVIDDTGSLTIGGGDVNFEGYISNARIVKGTAVYTGNFTPPTSPVTAITNTSLLLNFTNAGIIDNAMMNDLETVGNAQISTSVKKYGTGSLAFDGSGDYLTSNVATSNLYAFGAGDFTVELWLYLVAAPGAGSYVNLIDFRPVSTNGAYPTIYLSGSSATLTYFTNDADRITGSNISTATWYHIALCRSGTSTKLFIDGTQTGSTYTDSNSYICGTGRPTIGVNGYLLSTGQLNGYIDDLRITKGYARYTANFSVPTSAFPNN